MKTTHLEVDSYWCGAVGEDIPIVDINLRNNYCTVLRLYYSPKVVAKELRKIADWLDKQ